METKTSGEKGEIKVNGIINMLILTVCKPSITVLVLISSMTATFLTHNKSKVEFNGFNSMENLCVVNREFCCSFDLIVYHSIYPALLAFFLTTDCQIFPYL